MDVLVVFYRIILSVLLVSIQSCKAHGTHRDQTGARRACLGGADTLCERSHVGVHSGGEGPAEACCGVGAGFQGADTVVGCAVTLEQGGSVVGDRVDGLDGSVGVVRYVDGSQGTSAEEAHEQGLAECLGLHGGAWKLSVGSSWWMVVE